MSALPYMPLYVATYKGDTEHLTTLEHGAYLLLILNYWQRQKALPDDHRKLARIAGLSDGEWAEISDTIAEFFQIADGVWSHKRIEAELERAKAKMERAVNAGKASAEARRGDRQTGVEPTLNGCSTGAEQTTNHKVRLGKVSSLKTSLSEQGALAFAKFWEVWPHKVRQIAAEAAFADVTDNIDEILAGVARYIASRAPDQQWPDPAKWLSECRWRDEYAPRTTREAAGLATINAKRHVAGKVYVLQHTPQGEAWERFAKSSGRSQLWDRDGGWLFPSEWPPPEKKDSGEVIQLGRALSL